MNKILKIVLMAAWVLITCFAKSETVSAAGNPFICSTDFYQVISGQLTSLNPVTGTYTNIGAQQADAYNAIGYNVLDNYIYGFKTSVGDGIGAVGNLVRISNDGVLTDLGAVTGLPLATYVNGSSDLLGNMYLPTSSNTVYKVNISAMTATTLTTTGDSFVSAAENVLINNKLYMLSGSTLSVIDLGTNIVRNATVSGPSGWLTAGNIFGAGWTDAAGELFFSNNQSGSIYQISDLESPTPTATFKVTGTVTSNNDGANCPLARQSPFDPPVATNDSYTALYNSSLNETETSLLLNDMGNLLSVTSHTNPSHGSITINSNGSFVYTPSSGYIGSDSFEYTVTDSFGRTASARATITISTNPLPLAPATGYGTPTHTTRKILLLISLSSILIVCGVGLLNRHKQSNVSK